MTRKLILIALMACGLPGIAWAQSNLERAIQISSKSVSPGTHEIVVANRWYGPMQINMKLSPASSNVVSSVMLPRSWELPAQQGRVLFRVSPRDPTKPGNFSLSADAVPGSPSARHQVNYPYRWPLLNDVGRMDQGFGGNKSHADPENYFAIDITARPGSPVVASRPGKVMAVEDGYSQGGLDPALITKANFVRILHDDGSMAAYVHLQHRSVRVVPGQIVVAGQVLGGLGGVGYSSGPHLHFAVQVNSGMKLQSVRFKMFQPKGATKNL